MNQYKQQLIRRKQYTSQFYRGNHLAFFISVLSSLLIGALNLLIAWVLQQMIDSVSGISGSLKLSTLALLTVGIVILIVVFKMISYVSMPRFMKKAMQQYKDFTFRKLTQKSIASFSTENTSSYISAFSNDATSIENNYLDKLFSLLANGIKLVGSLVMMLTYSPIMTVIACAFFVLPIGVLFIAGNRVEKAEQKVSDKNESFVATLKDSLIGFSVIKSFKAESAIINLFGKSNQNVEQAKCEKRKISTIISTLGGVAGVIAQLGTFLLGACLAIAGLGITPGILLIFIDLTSNVINPVQEMPELFAARKAAVALIDKLADALDSNVRDEGEHIPNRLDIGIEFKNVSFGYEANNVILHDIKMNFEAGKSYAIVGASGSGKSTLLNLLMASHSDYSGEICYDGYELKEISSESLYDIVSMIQQNVFVFNASIRDNITMFHYFPKDEVDKAIELSGLSALIKKRGEDYLCGENGSGLSGGEKQRISIARSLLRNSSVLLVDEATAALDAQTAYQVSSSILGLDNMTCIVVTHTLDESLLRKYDCIIALKNGYIEETGNYEELMEQHGYFYSLYTVSQ